MSEGIKNPAPPAAEASKAADKTAEGPGASASSDVKVNENTSRDLVVLNGPTSDGEGVRVVRLREESVEVGEMRALKEGVPIGTGDVVKLHAREGSPLVWDVEVQYSGSGKSKPQTSGHAGPARVSNAAYRKNWDSIFGRSEDDSDEKADTESGKVLN